MSVTREDFEVHVRSLVAAAARKPTPSEAFVNDAIAMMANRLDELALWPGKIEDMRITLLPPCLRAGDVLPDDGYAGWTVPDPRGAEHPPLGALFKFEYRKYAEGSTA